MGNKRENKQYLNKDRERKNSLLKNVFEKVGRKKTKITVASPNKYLKLKNWGHKEREGNKCKNK